MSSNPKQPETILLEAERIINGERRDDYGTALDSFTKIAEGWAMVLGHPISPEEVALCMVQLKIARWLNGQQRDSLVDICGYTGCIEQVQQERTRRLGAIKAEDAQADQYEADDREEFPDEAPAGETFGEKLTRKWSTTAERR